MGTQRCSPTPTSARAKRVRVIFRIQFRHPILQWSAAIRCFIKSNPHSACMQRGFPLLAARNTTLLMVVGDSACSRPKPRSFLSTRMHGTVLVNLARKNREGHVATWRLAGQCPAYTCASQFGLIRFALSRSTPSSLRPSYLLQVYNDESSAAQHDSWHVPVRDFYRKRNTRDPTSPTQPVHGQYIIISLIKHYVGMTGTWLHSRFVLGSTVSPAGPPTPGFAREKRYAMRPLISAPYLPTPTH